jgi:hypothetical protein
MVAGPRCTPSNASTHRLISGSDAHSRSRMAVLWRGSAASTAALKTASIRLASTAMASSSESGSLPSCGHRRLTSWWISPGPPTRAKSPQQSRPSGPPTIPTLDLPVGADLRSANPSLGGPALELDRRPRCAPPSPEHHPALCPSRRALRLLARLGTPGPRGPHAGSSHCKSRSRNPRRMVGHCQVVRTRRRMASAQVVSGREPIHGPDDG